MDVSMDRFEQLVADALDVLPDALGELMDNVVVLVEETAPEPGLLGLYEGVPLTERSDYGGLELPDRITLYRRQLCAMCHTDEELVHEVTVTVVHEIAHHFGINDDQLHELGWD